MPHRIDIDGISRNLFVLRHLAVGSRPVCQELRIDRYEEGDKLLGWNYYLGWLKFIVSQTLIETAIKVRIMQDFLKADPEGSTDIGPVEAEINAAHVIGHFVPALTPLPLREACNKIIHASDVTLVWLDSQDKQGKYEFWNGTVNLDGSKGAEAWSCQLYTPAFCTALEAFLMRVEEIVDWHYIFKYDE